MSSIHSADSPRSRRLKEAAQPVRRPRLNSHDIDRISFNEDGPYIVWENDAEIENPSVSGISPVEYGMAMLGLNEQPIVEEQSLMPSARANAVAAEWAKRAEREQLEDDMPLMPSAKAKAVAAEWAARAQREDDEVA